MLTIGVSLLTVTVRPVSFASSQWCLGLITAHGVSAVLEVMKEMRVGGVRLLVGWFDWMWLVLGELVQVNTAKRVEQVVQGCKQWRVFCAY